MPRLDELLARAQAAGGMAGAPPAGPMGMPGEMPPGTEGMLEEMPPPMPEGGDIMTAIDGLDAAAETLDPEVAKAVRGKINEIRDLVAGSEGEPEEAPPEEPGAEMPLPPEIEGEKPL